jgi:hypothetical protein
MRVLQKVVARMSVIPGLGAFAFGIMRVCVHLVLINQIRLLLETTPP